MIFAQLKTLFTRPIIALGTILKSKERRATRMPAFESSITTLLINKINTDLVSAKPSRLSVANNNLNEHGLFGEDVHEHAST